MSENISTVTELVRRNFELGKEIEQLKQQLQEKEELIIRQRDCANEASKSHRVTLLSNNQLKQQLQVAVEALGLAVKISDLPKENCISLNLYKERARQVLEQIKTMGE